VAGPLAPLPDDAVERLRRERIAAAMRSEEKENSGIFHKLRAIGGRMTKARGA